MDVATPCWGCSNQILQTLPLLLEARRVPFAVSLAIATTLAHFVSGMSRETERRRKHSCVCRVMHDA